MFKKLFRKNNEFKVLAPLSGEIVTIGAVNDPTFSEELLGKGIAVKPDGGRIVSPVEGTVTQMFSTGHAVTLTSKGGVEVLIHIGLDTVKLKGQHFTIIAKDGDSVSPGDPLMEFDAESIAAAGFDTVTPIVIVNTGDFKTVKLTDREKVAEQDELIFIEK